MTDIPYDELWRRFQQQYAERLELGIENDCLRTEIERLRRSKNASDEHVRALDAEVMHLRALWDYVEKTNPTFAESVSVAVETAGPSAD